MDGVSKEERDTLLKELESIVCKPLTDEETLKFYLIYKGYQLDPIYRSMLDIITSAYSLAILKGPEKARRFLLEIVSVVIKER